MNALAEAPSVEERRRMNRELAERYHQITPGSAAESELIEKYIPMVKAVVGRLAMNLPSHVSKDDLYSSGLVGLLNAVRNFDPRGGSSFDSYARVRIRGAIIDELRQLDWVPRSVHDKAKVIEATIQEVEQEKGDVAKPEEVARALGVSLSEYEEMLEEVKPATFVSLDSVFGDDDSSTRHESVGDVTEITPDETAARREMTRVIAERMKQLPDLQRKVLALYYHEGMYLREIAEVFGVTESRICQIHAQAILNIRSYIRRYDRSAV
jgi:RNA polymerase sigma factor FliA